MLKYDLPQMFCITKVNRNGEQCEKVLVKHTGFSYNYLIYEDLISLYDAIRNTLDLYDELGLDTDEKIEDWNARENRREQDSLIHSVNEKKVEKKPKRDHLYIISDKENGAFKVGRSVNPESRLKSMQTASSHNLSLVIYYENCGYKEEKLHELLKEYRLCGEWFIESDTTWDIVDSFMTGETCCYPYAK